ncbi:hypothetical protein BJV82DRAFT_672665 [Fennellomyces sp. T-0311]|nr:hypothetical protein BJV82DRAFT_672665 [Fennellomyces sp. T-0311]
MVYDTDNAHFFEGQLSEELRQFTRGEQHERAREILTSLDQQFPTALPITPEEPGVHYIRSALSNLIDVWDSYILQPELQDESDHTTSSQRKKGKQKVYEDSFRIIIIAKLLDVAFLHSSDSKALRSEITPALRHDRELDTVLGEEKPQNSSKGSITLGKIKCELMRTKYLQHYLKSVPKEYKSSGGETSTRTVILFTYVLKAKNAIPALAHCIKALLQSKERASRNHQEYILISDSSGKSKEEIRTALYNIDYSDAEYTRKKTSGLKTIE